LDKQEKALRAAIVEKCRWMNAIGLNQGTSGNISARYGDRMLLTPSAIPYDIMTGDMIASMPIEGEYGAWEGRHRPSTEWRFHLDIMKERPDVGAIIHTHATYATILSIARKPIPACHYMIAVFGGTDVRCAEYATFGTKALAENAVKALKDRNGCLLANHGMIAAGENLEKAMWLAVELETIAKQYYHTLLIGGGVILPAAAIEETRVSMKQQKEGYGLTDLTQIGVGPRRSARKAPARATRR
jgi:L-fuculose-phosphate aldolase